MTRKVDLMREERMKNKKTNQRIIEFGYDRMNHEPQQIHL